MNNTPAIRFVGFTDEWKQRNTGKAFSFLQNNTLSRAELNSETGIAKNIHYGDVLIKFGEYLNASEDALPYILDEHVLEKFSSSALQDGDVIMADTAEDETVGKCTEIGGTGDIPILSGLHTIPMRPREKYATGFLGYYMNSVGYHDQLLPLMQGTKVTSVSKSAIQDTSITFPPDLCEQAAIGKSFILLDHYLAFQQREYEKLVSLKAACLDKMFPQNGSKVPELRFAGFTDDWEQRKVADVANRYDNLRIPVAANLRVPGTTPYYGANGIQDYVDGFTHEGEFVLVAEDGANDLKNYPVKCVNGRIWVNNHAHVLQSKPEMADNKFLAYSISQADIEALLVGGGRAKLNAEVMMGIDLVMPSLPEQIAIGRYLTQLDDLITLHQRKLEKLKQLKQAMLYKMLV